MSSTRERILARRALFVAGLCVSGCSSTPVRTTEKPVASADTDGDGIPDELDKCPYTPGPATSEGCPKACLSIVPAATIRINVTIAFEKDSAKLTPESVAALQDMSPVLKDHPELHIDVRGHVAPGEQPALFRTRAEAVAGWLVKDGVPATQLTVVEGTGRNEAVVDFVAR